MARSWLGELVDLVMPADCAGCGARGQVLCPTCWAAVAGPVRRAEAGADRLCPADGAAPLPVWSCAAYEGPVRQAVAQWKRAGRLELTSRFGEAVGRIGRYIGPAVGRVIVQTGCQLAVVPVPSRRGSQLKRGSYLAAELAQAVSAGLTQAGLNPLELDLLARRSGSRDQVGLGAHQRAANRVAATRVRLSRLPGQTHLAVLLVDDIVTTGASLLDAERALASASTLTLGAVVLAATPPRPASRKRSI